MKTEEETYNEIMAYINGTKHNRPCTLAFYKKQLRTKKIVELVFSRPDIFDLSKEFPHIPVESLTEDILVRFILANPNNITLVDESLLTLPVMLAFEFSKRRSEYLSALIGGNYRKKILYPKNILQYQERISNLCDTLNIKYNDETILEDYLAYIEQVSVSIKECCQENDKTLEEEPFYERKYYNVDFNVDELVFILVSGVPDSGKSIFSNLLASRIKNSICFDSDMLLETDALLVPLSTIIGDKAKVVVFSDIDAYRFFEQKYFENSKVINILIKPRSVETMYRHSKHMQSIPFEQYKKYEIDSIKYDELIDPIIVINDYTNKIESEVDRVLEEISKILGVELFESEDDNMTALNRKRIK